MELENLGKIIQMTLPEDWIEEKKKSNWAQMLTYSAPSDSSVQLSFYYRGKAINSRSASSFRETLQKPEHILDAAEVQAIEVVIRDASEPEYFDLKTARTSLINGQKVLIVDGFWKLNKVENMSVFIDDEGDGRTISEIYYVAPVDRFEKFKDVVLKSLQTIVWKN